MFQDCVLKVSEVCRPHALGERETTAGANRKETVPQTRWGGGGSQIEQKPAAAAASTEDGATHTQQWALED